VRLRARTTVVPSQGRFIIGLAIARKIAARDEDDLVHLTVGAEQAISKQVVVALTVVDGLFAVVLLAIMLYIPGNKALSMVVK